MSLTGKCLTRFLRYYVWGELKNPRAKPRKRMTAKRGPARSPQYRAWIRTLPCLVCGREQVDAAHTGDDGGMALKASDLSCVPLCPYDHTFGPYAYHRIGKPAFEERYGLNFARIARDLNRQYREERNEGRKVKANALFPR